jgi:hypothetical protein
MVLGAGQTYPQRDLRTSGTQATGSVSTASSVATTIDSLVISGYNAWYFQSAPMPSSAELAAGTKTDPWLRIKLPERQLVQSVTTYPTRTSTGNADKAEVRTVNPKLDTSY